MIRHVIRCAVVAAAAPLFLVVAPVYAAPDPTPAPTPSASPVTLRSIATVVTSDRRVEPIELTSRPTFVVDRSHIEAFGDRTVADALQDVPGVHLQPYGAFGSQTDYGIRGTTAAQTLVLVDGLPITDPTTGAVQLSQFSTIGVQRIEIVESGSSTLYGTAASGGVINIITRIPCGAYLAASLGSFGDRDVRASVGDGTLGFAFERHTATDAYPYAALNYGPGHSYPGGIRSDAAAESSTGRLTVALPDVAGFRVRGRVDASATNVGAPGSLEYPSTTAVQYTSSGGALIEFERTIATSTLSVTLGGSTTRLAYDDLVGNGGESDVSSGRTQIALKDALTLGRFDAIAGVDLARESGVFSFPANYAAPNTPASALGAAQSQSAAYVQAGIGPFGGARITAGLRAENDAPSGSVLAPSFGGSIRSGALRLSANVGESFRVPTLNDLYYPGFSNPRLQPEKAQTADATIAFEVARATLSAGWFDRNGSNFIVLDPVTFVPVNAQRAQSAGIVLTAGMRPLPGIVADLGFTNLYRALDVSTGARLPESPVDQVTLTIAHPFADSAPGRLAYGFRYGIVGSDGSDTANVARPVGTFDAYDRLDAYVRYALTHDAVLSVRGTNLGNTGYAPIFGYPAPGRAFTIEVSTR